MHACSIAITISCLHKQFGVKQIHECTGEKLLCSRTIVAGRVSSYDQAKSRD